MYELFEGLMADLLIKKPNNPIAHMIASLKQPPRPRVFVFGPPGADTQSQCELISSKLGLVHVVPKAVWREAAKGGSEAGASAKALEDEGKEVPLELKVSMLVEKRESAECKANGWVLDGFPANPDEARRPSAPACCRRSRWCSSSRTRRRSPRSPAAASTPRRTTCTTSPTRRPPTPPWRRASSSAPTTRRPPSAAASASTALPLRGSRR